MHIQPADTLAIHSKKLQEDLQELEQKIKHHEDNIEDLKTQKNKLEESIVGTRTTIDQCHSSSLSTTQNQNLAHVQREEEKQILEHDKSAASLLCMVKNQNSDHPLTKDMLGIVACLGKVDDDNLSRLLSEYLGIETMLAVVCKTLVGVKALESYGKEGSISKSSGLYAFASSTGRPLKDPFLVISLETLRPYSGEFIADDPQRRLDLPKPRLANGGNPHGFLGFAVNMISIDKTHLYSTCKNGIGLRETLFYNLFSMLQVYRSSKHMLKAIQYITNGAISLDGGMIKSPGIVRLGPSRELIKVKFPIGSKSSNPLEHYLELEKQIKETRWKKDRTGDDLEREQTCLDYAKVNYETKKREFVQFLAESSGYSAQAVHASTSR